MRQNWFNVQFTVGIITLIVAVSASPVRAQFRGIGVGSADASGNRADPFGIAGFDWSRISDLGIEQQTNLRAAAILRHCQIERHHGTVSPTLSVPRAAAGHNALTDLLSRTSAFGLTDINLITGTDTLPHVTQATSSSWAHGNTVVVAFVDSSGFLLPQLSFCAVAVSTNGGATFTRSNYRFNTAGQCFGNMSVFYSLAAAKWFASGFNTSCGDSGIAQWESPDGINWTTSGCVVTSNNLDNPTSWVDNNPSSPYYGRQYVAFNNFMAANGAASVTYSSDGGVNWAPAVLVNFDPAFKRALKITGSLGADGTIFVQLLQEGGGGLNNLRQNIIVRSTNGGANWTSVNQGPAFLGPGRNTCPGNSYWATMYTGQWRDMGWGQPGVGPNGVIHYVYSSRPGTGTDPGNIYYLRSGDNGGTWSTPLQLNTDATTRAQWGPSLSVNRDGAVSVSWYDERNTTNDSLERFGRASVDNGLNWGPDQAFSDIIFPVPGQVDPNIVPCYGGDYNHASFSNDGSGNTAFHTWTDGRVSLGGNPQEDVVLDRVSFTKPKANFDFDNDGRTDVAVYRLATGAWYILNSGNNSFRAESFGAAGDRIVPADYDGDGKTDIAVWRSSNGAWYRVDSSTNTFRATSWGANGDIPAPGDFDGDRRAEVSVYRPSSGTFYVLLADSNYLSQQWGQAGDVPLIGDFDADGRADFSVYRASSSSFYQLLSATGGTTAVQWGTPGDKPFAGDVDGDARTDVTVYRPSTGGWYAIRSSDQGITGIGWGTAGDLPAGGDYDGDGKLDVAVFRPSTGVFYILQSASASLRATNFGTNGDSPVPGAFVP
ncbi:MAG: FG-GAP-like repeat-containing protein [Pyrinomonadaceae bacterium]